MKTSSESFHFHSFIATSVCFYFLSEEKVRRDEIVFVNQLIAITISLCFEFENLFHCRRLWKSMKFSVSDLFFFLSINLQTQIRSIKTANAMDQTNWNQSEPFLFKRTRTPKYTNKSVCLNTIQQWITWIWINLQVICFCYFWFVLLVWIRWTEASKLISDHWITLCIFTYTD